MPRLPKKKLIQKNKIDDDLVDEKVKNHIYSKLDQNNLLAYDAGWKIFDIGFETELHDPALGRLLGQTIFDNGTIKLDPNQKHADAVETLLHEIFHVITEACGLGEPDNKTKKLVLENEELVNLISRGLIQAVRLNKDLFQEIFDGIR